MWRHWHIHIKHPVLVVAAVVIMTGSHFFPQLGLSPWVELGFTLAWLQS